MFEGIPKIISWPRTGHEDSDKYQNAHQFPRPLTDLP